MNKIQKIYQKVGQAVCEGLAILAINAIFIARNPNRIIKFIIFNTFIVMLLLLIRRMYNCNRTNAIEKPIKIPIP